MRACDRVLGGAAASELADPKPSVTLNGHAEGRLTQSTFFNQDGSREFRVLGRLAIGRSSEVGVRARATAPEERWS